MGSTFAPNGYAVQLWTAHTITPGVAHLSLPDPEAQMLTAVDDIVAERAEKERRLAAKDVTKVVGHSALFLRSSSRVDKVI